MAEQLSREKIVLCFREKMIEALEGRCIMMDVCGLGIEALRASIIGERNSLLKHYGYLAAGDNEAGLLSNSSENKDNF